MKSNKTSYTLVALAAAAILAFMPVVAADPISPSLNWSSQNVAQGLSNMATATVAIDPDCPSGQTYSGTITVTEPDGVSVGTFTVPATACGTDVTVSYPSGFAGAAGTLELGMYTATWAGASSVSNGGMHPSFSVTNHFSVIAFPPPPIPEFGAPAMLVAAIGLLLVVAVRTKKTLKV